MYKNGFVLAVKKDGKVLREMDGKVFLPFYDEYALLLKNKNSRDAVATITIDGTDISNGRTFIIRGDSEANIERFLVDDDLTKGQRFKFVPASSADVQDPTSKENGLLKVVFRLAKKVIPVETKYDIYVGSAKPDTPISACAGFGSTLSRRAGGQSAYRATTSSAGAELSACSFSSADAGATVGGSMSMQQFSTGWIGELETEETEIWLRLVPTESKPITTDVKNKFCMECGAKLPFDAKFCSDCGNKQNI